MTSADKAKFGMMGLGVMGQNLVLNVERNGFRCAVWNRTPQKAIDFVNDNEGKNLVACETVEDFVAALEPPRTIMLLVKAGGPVDATIDMLKPHLEEGDIIIDGGNSHFADTRRREKSLREEGLAFVGCGVSGGETGALYGPSMMPGGTAKAWERMQPIFEAIAAKVDDGACVTHVGADGAGHFVKMVHNGIEYGDMQLIAEAYELLKSALGLSADELAKVFAEWDDGLLDSYLIEITAKIFTVKDEDGGALVEKVMDKAGQKGTGRWTSSIALDLGVAVPTIHAAIVARVMSALKSERVEASGQIAAWQAGDYEGDKQELIDAVRDALYASKICSYAQGMALIQAGAAEFDWTINLQEVARIWKGGCIIRARFLDKIQDAYKRRADLPNLLQDPEFQKWAVEAQPRWRRVVQLAVERGVAVPAMAASLAYFDSYRSARLPQNLTQAQRDFFGAHTYQRVDDPDGAFVHTDWNGLTGGSTK